MKILRTAVVGLGRIGWQYHIPQIIRHKGFELTCVVDPLPERLEEAREKFSVKGFPDMEQMLEADKADLIVIASPTAFHAEQAVYALSHGMDVFMEKPFAQSLEEADRMIDAMKIHNRKMMSYQPHRITPELVTLKSILGRGLIGKVFMIKRACSSYVRRNDWQAFKKNGGGMLNNYGAHYIDQLLYVAEAEAQGIFCNMKKIASLGDAEDVVKLLIETKNGILLDLDINMAAAYSLPEWIIMGTNGTILYNRDANGNGYFQVRYFLKEELGRLELQIGLAASARNYSNFDSIPWKEERVSVSDTGEVDFYDHCYEYFALDQEPFVPVSETREVMRIISECRKTAGWVDAAGSDRG